MKKRDRYAYPERPASGSGADLLNVRGGGCQPGLQASV